MVSDYFESLLHELGEALKIDNLSADANNTCLLQFNEHDLQVQIEPYQKGDFLLICSDLGNVPRGRYREDVFREALKTNGLAPPRHGIFAFSEQTDHLVLYALLSMRELNGEKIAAFLTTFIEKGSAWKQAIASGVVPVANTMRTSRAAGPTGMFGLRP